MFCECSYKLLQTILFQVVNVLLLNIHYLACVTEPEPLIYITKKEEWINQHYRIGDATTTVHILSQKEYEQVHGLSNEACDLVAVKIAYLHAVKVLFARQGLCNCQ